MRRQRTLRLLEPGESAPDFSLERLDGGSDSLAKLAAETSVLLAFLKISCPICQLTLPFLERIHAAGGLRIVAISQNAPRDTRRFNQEFGLTMPTLLDTESSGYAASNAYGISSVPTMFLLEKGGRISRVMEGWNRKEIEQLGAETGVNVIRDSDHVPAWKAG